MTQLGRARNGVLYRKSSGLQASNLARGDLKFSLTGFLPRVGLPRGLWSEKEGCPRECELYVNKMLRSGELGGFSLAPWCSLSEAGLF